MITRRLNPPLQSVLVDERSGWMLDDGVELVRFEFHAPTLSHFRRVVGIR